MCILRRPGVVNNLKSFKYKLNPPPTILDHIMKDGICLQILNSQSIVFFLKCEIFQKLYNLQGCTQLKKPVMTGPPFDQFTDKNQFRLLRK